MERLEDRLLLTASIFDSPSWVAEGPAPITDANSTTGAIGNVLGPTTAESLKVGAINQAAFDPFDPTHLMVATVNGGIWQTSSAHPGWTTKTDNMPSLAIASVAFSPALSGVIYAGTGSYSSVFNGNKGNTGTAPGVAGTGQGDPAIGIYKSVDGGNTWQIENPSSIQYPNGIFTGLRVIRIVPTSLNGGQTVFAATTDGPNGGVFRSNDGGSNWQRLSGANGLPNSGVTDLVINPRNTNQFFAATGNSLAGNGAGVYLLDVGVSNTAWKNVTNNMIASDLSGSARIELSISPAGDNPIWASVINSSGYYQRIYRGVASGGTIVWTGVGPATFSGYLPPDVLNGNQGDLHGAILADPNYPNLVYVSGDASYSGSGTTTAYIARGDSNLETWTGITPVGTVLQDPNTVIPTDNGVTTSPHADSRDMIFGVTGLILTCDGGIYQCLNPESTTSGAQKWTSLNGSIQDTEAFGVSYDSQFNIIFAGVQDNGWPSQNAPTSLSYNSQGGGDGGATAVDNFSLAGSNESTRYFGFGGGLTRRIFSAADTRAPGDQDAQIFPPTFSGLTNTSPDDLFSFAAINSVSGRIAAAGNVNGATPGAIYVATDAGSASESNIGGTEYVNDNWSQIPTAAGFGQASAIAFGGKQSGNANPNVMYVASQSPIPGNPGAFKFSGIYFRTQSGSGTLTATTGQPIGAGPIGSIALDPNNWQTAFITDNTNVYMTTDGGASWQNITGNLTNPPGSRGGPAFLAVIPGSGGVDALFFGGTLGVSRMLTSSQGVWTRFGFGLPNVFVSGLVYSTINHNDVLVASTYGRGFWEVPNASTVAFSSGTLSILSDNSNGNVIIVRADPTYPQFLQVLQNNQVEYEGPGSPSPISNINIFPGPGANTVDIQDLPANITLTVDSFGTDTVTINKSGVGVQNIAGIVNVDTASAIQMNLTVDDVGDTGSQQTLLVDDASRAGWGSVMGPAPGQINYQYSPATSLTVESDAAQGNVVAVGQSGVPTTVIVDAVTNVYLGTLFPSVTTQGLLGNISLKSDENGTPDEGNLIVTILDLSDQTARTATLTTFVPSNYKNFGAGPGILVPDSPWGQISGMAQATISYEYADTASVSIDGGSAGDQIVDNQTGSGRTPVTLNATPNVTSISPASGPLGGGTVVAIHGSHLGGASAYVLFGTTAAMIDTSMNNTDTEVFAYAPSSNLGGTVDVTVGNSFGERSAPSPADQFDYLDPPLVVAVTPAAGPVAGGNTVVITGEFLGGASAVDFGANNPGMIVSDVQLAPTPFWVLTANAPAAVPAGALGTVHVTVTTPGGTSATSAADKYTYTALPVVSSVDPGAGPTAGGTLVTILGANFTGASAVYFGNTMATTYTLVSSGEITATIPAESAGPPVDVRVVTAGGESAASPNDLYTYYATPTVTSISPTSGPFEGGTAVTITGTNLQDVGGPVVRFGNTEATVESHTATQIVALSPATAALGPVDVTVSTPGGTSAMSNADLFTYKRVQPIVASISPSQGLVAGGTSVTISGSYFADAQQVYFGGTPAQHLYINSDSSITAISPMGASGARVDVTVYAWGMTSSTSVADQFTYEPLPTVTAVNATFGPAKGGATVIISGTNLAGASAVDFGGVAATIVADAGTQLEVYTPPGTPGATVDVTVTTAQGTSPTSSADQYTYNPGPPVVTGLGPSAGPVGGGTTVTIAGYGLLNPTAVDFGTVPATIVSSTNNQVVVQSPAAASAGAVDVTVTTGAGTSAELPADQFLYGSAPEIYGLYNYPLTQHRTTGPAYDSAADWPVAIYGVNFTGATEVDFGSAAVTNLTIGSNGTVILLYVPYAPPGTVDVRVVTPLGPSAITSGDQFTFEPGPYVTSVNNNVSGSASGPPSGGEMLTISGDFLANAQSIDFGGTTVTSFTYSANPNGVGGTLSFLGPAGSPGVVDVTVTTTAGTSSTTANDQFTFLPAPTVTGVFPAIGPTTGGNNVVITGSGFYGNGNSVHVSFGGIAALITGFSLDSTFLEVNAPANATPGTVEVTVTTESGTSAVSPADQYNYIDMPTPTVTGLSTNSGPLTGGTTVVISGAGVQYATTVDFGAFPARFTVDGDGTLTATSPDVSYVGNVSTVDVTVTTPVGTSAAAMADQFTYVPPPAVTSVSPSSGSVYGGTVVTIVGANLAGATEVDFGSKPGIIAGNIDNQGVDTLTVVSPEAAGDQPANVYLTVTTPYGSVVGVGPFAYALPPTLTGLSQSSGPAAGGTYITIQGSNLSTATAVDFGSVAATNFSWVPQFGVLVAYSPQDSAGTVDVTVTTLGGTTPIVPSDQFTYLPPPTVTSLSPSAGPISGGTSVTIDGTGLSDATEVDFGNDAASFTVNPDGSITATSPHDDQGPTVDVTVMTPEGSTAVSTADQFTYVAAPSVSGVSPGLGNTLGGNIVTINGANLGGATAVDFGPNAGTILYDSANQIQVVSPAGAVGTVDVTVVAPGGTSPTSSADRLLYVGAPLAMDDSYTVTPNTTLTVAAAGVLANDTDPQGYPLTAELLANPLHGALSFNGDGSFTYTPDNGYVGVDGFVYQADNGIFTSAPTTVSLAIGTLTVTTAADSGPGSLRQAILDANGTPGTAHMIQFELPAGPQTINLLTSLPAATDPLTVSLDATQNVTVVLSSATAWNDNYALTVTGAGRLAFNGGIEGPGNLTIEAGSSLTANHIVQSALVIGGTAGSPATVTIAASDSSGNPLISAAVASSSNSSDSALSDSVAGNAGTEATLAERLAASRARHLAQQLAASPVSTGANNASSGVALPPAVVSSSVPTSAAIQKVISTAAGVSPMIFVHAMVQVDANVKSAAISTVVSGSLGAPVGESSISIPLADPIVAPSSVASQTGSSTLQGAADTRKRLDADAVAAAFGSDNWEWLGSDPVAGPTYSSMDDVGGLRLGDDLLEAIGKKWGN